MLTDAPRAIETVYKGYRFRSRLEARWAVLLDALGITYEYEREGYTLANGMRYLPDFWLPDLNLFIEVKGQSVELGDDEWTKAQLLSEETECRVVMFIGQISDNPGDVRGLEFNPYKIGGEGHEEYLPVISVWWFQCLICKKWDLAQTVTECQCICLYVHPARQPALVDACKRARQARFEFGEHG